MKPTTIIRITIGCVIGLPIVLMSVGALSLSAATDDGTASIQTDAAPSGGFGDGLANLGRKLIGTQEALPADTLRRDTFDTTLYSDRRKYSVDHILPITAFLQPGEAAPLPEQELLWATARAPRLLMQDCALPLDTIARGCAFGSSEVSRDTASGDIRLTGALYLLPAAAPGDLTGTEDWGIDTIQVNLPRDRAVLSQVDPLDLPGARADLMRIVQAECDTLRDETGTCVITHVTLNLDANRNGTFQLRATADMAWLQAPHESDADEGSGGLLARFRGTPDQDSTADTADADTAANVVITKGGNALNAGRTLKPGQNSHFQKVDASQ